MTSTIVRQQALSQATKLDGITPETFAAVMADFLETGRAPVESDLIPPQEINAGWGNVGVWWGVNGQSWIDAEDLFCEWYKAVPDSNAHKAALPPIVPGAAQKAIARICDPATSQDDFSAARMTLFRIVSLGLAPLLKGRLREFLDPLLALPSLTEQQAAVANVLIINIGGLDSVRDREYLEHHLSRADITGTLRLRLLKQYVLMKGDFDIVMQDVCREWRIYTDAPADYKHGIFLAFLMEDMSSVYGIVRTCDAIYASLPEKNRALFYPKLVDMYGDVAAYGRKVLGIREPRPASP